MLQLMRGRNCSCSCSASLVVFVVVVVVAVVVVVVVVVWCNVVWSQLCYPFRFLYFCYPSVYLSVYLFGYQSVCLFACLSSHFSILPSIHPCVCLCVWLPGYKLDNETILHDFVNLCTWQHQKRRNSTRLPQFLNLTTSTTKQSCENSSIFELDSIKNEAELTASYPQDLRFFSPCV